MVEQTKAHRRAFVGEALVLRIEAVEAVRERTRPILLQGRMVSLEEDAADSFEMPVNPRVTSSKTPPGESHFIGGDAEGTTTDPSHGRGHHTSGLAQGARRP